MYQKQVHQYERKHDGSPDKRGKNDHYKNDQRETYANHRFGRPSATILGIKKDGTKSTKSLGRRVKTIHSHLTDAELRILAVALNRKWNHERDMIDNGGQTEFRQHHKSEDFRIPPGTLIDCGCKTRRDHNDALCPCKPRKFNPTTHTSACKCDRPATNKRR